MWGSTVLEVVIGLVVVYLTLSLVCSTINEGFASALTWRATTLRDAIARLMYEAPPSATGYIRRFLKRPLNELGRLFSRKNDDPWSGPRTQSIYSHPLISSLSADEGKDPSYVPNGAFADVVIDRLAPVSTFTDPSARVMRIAERLRPQPAAKLTAVAGEMDLSTAADLRATLRLLFDKAQSRASDAGAGLLGEFHTELCAWFESTMGRATGWYRRKTQAWLYVVATVIVLLTNADTIAIVDQLSRNPALRETLGVAAQEIVRERHENAAAGTVPTDKDLAKQLMAQTSEAGMKLGWPGTDADGIATWTARMDQHGAFGADGALGSAWLWRKIAGLLITMFAVALGAPFWFQVLEKVVKLRSAGSNPSAASAATPAVETSVTTTTSGDGKVKVVTASVGAGVGSGDAVRADSKPPDWVRRAERAKATPLTGEEAPSALLASYWASLAYEPKWRIEKIAQDMGLSDVQYFESGGTQAFGAVHPDGRVIVAFRGTEPREIQDLLADADAMKVKGPFDVETFVHRGFDEALKQVFDAVRAYVAKRAGAKPTLVTGHSLGAALATLFVSRTLADDPNAAIELVTFGSPRVGDARFAKKFDEKTLKDGAVRAKRVLRFVNHQDLVTRVAPRSVGYEHVGDVRYFDALGKLTHGDAEWLRFLSLVIDASAEFKSAARGTVKDHSMDLYVQKLENWTRASA